jgi:hypothetical protein
MLVILSLFLEFQRISFGRQDLHLIDAVLAAGDDENDAAARPDSFQCVSIIEGATRKRDIRNPGDGAIAGRNTGFTWTNSRFGVVIFSPMH